jgi:UTP-glucose-1-phosphate uridylyltransferase
MDAILPAAGLATRMRGLPKFLLPCSEGYTTLLEHHIEALLGVCDRVWVAVRPEVAALVDILKIADDRVILVNLTTATMSETVLKVTRISMAESFLVVMPDTFFFGDQPYRFLAELEQGMRVAAWEIRRDQIGKLGQIALDDTNSRVEDSRDKDPDCVFPFSWGAISFDRDFVRFIDPSTPHVGFMIPAALSAGELVHANVIAGTYFDCGTPAEYFSMISQLELVSSSENL